VVESFSLVHWSEQGSTGDAESGEYGSVNAKASRVHVEPAL
jgi:hypothetical protein